ncbi:hypothetical protein AB0L99_44515 [Streptomyces sp. NPDC051954]|uniref:hypothetical protein n=1 Tax=unclassified Streptomyces TaxID=2593676 RepID=UPI003427ACA6
MVLGTDGGLAYWVLVVTGLERGRVWPVADVSAYPYPLLKALDFLDRVQRRHTGNGWSD